MYSHEIGIDPGYSGAVAVRVVETGELKIFDTPVIAKADVQNDKIYRYKQEAMARVLMPYRQNAVATIEHQRAYGYNSNAMHLAPLLFGYGLWQMALSILGISICQVSPTVWKKGILKRVKVDKHLSVAVAKGMFPYHKYPEVFNQLIVSKDGRADALLLMEWGRRNEWKSEVK